MHEKCTVVFIFVKIVDMQDKHLTKSFGIRVPLNLYMQMLSLSVEHKISMTDICLSAIMNSSIIEGRLDFGKGGKVNAEALVEIQDLKRALGSMERTIAQKSFEIRQLEELIPELRKEGSNRKTLLEMNEKNNEKIRSLENEMVERHNRIKQLTAENKEVTEQKNKFESELNKINYIKQITINRKK